MRNQTPKITSFLPSLLRGMLSSRPVSFIEADRVEKLGWNMETVERQGQEIAPAFPAVPPSMAAMPLPSPQG